VACAIALAAAGCNEELCTRNSECETGFVCTREAVCELAPDASSGPDRDAGAGQVDSGGPFDLPDAGAEIDAGDASFEVDAGDGDDDLGL
jgi:hypothetical protein